MSESENKMKPLRLGRLSPAGRALRDIAGGRTGVVEEAIDIQLRTSDFQVISVRSSGGREMPAPTQALIQFVAQQFMELVEKGRGTDVWKFRVNAGQNQAGDTQWAWVYVAGKDILTVRVTSKVL